MATALAVVSSAIAFLVFSGGASATHPAGQPIPAGEDPYWTCSASTARATVAGGDPIPPVDPLAANLEREECAEDLGGLPDIGIPPADPLVATKTAQARTRIFCAGMNDFSANGGFVDPDQPPVEGVDDPATPGDDGPCDAGVPAYRQRVLSTAKVTDTTIRLGSGENALEITVRAANTSAQARCGPGTNFVPILRGTSQVLDLSIRRGEAVPTQVPVPIITGDPNQVIEVPGLIRITLNELIVAGGGQPNAQGDFVFAETPTDRDREGALTRRAVHVEVLPGGPIPLADVVVAESVADFHGDVCPESRVVVRKETVPDQAQNTTNFPFTSSPGLDPDNSFNLTDDDEEVFTEVQPFTAQGTPRTYTVTETAGTTYSLAAINCVENRTENTATSLNTRTATVAVEPGETVTCTFINAVCPPGSELNNAGECVILQITCPPGSTLNNQGQCVVDLPNCPPGSSRPPGNPTGPCIVENPTCPTGSQPNNQGQCIIDTTTCPPGSSRPPGQTTGPCVVENPTCPPGSTPSGSQCITNTTTCPPGSTDVGGTCVVSQPNCPPGTTRNAQGQCIISNVQCPAGTTFNPVTLGCTEAPRGGTLVPLNIPQITNLFRGSPCIGQGFGPLVGIIGTNGPDRITGTNTSDRIFALAGNDRVSGGRGDDCVEGGSGRDVIDGSNGNDVMLGASEGDQIVGGPGRDRMDGGSGRDNLSGANGSDTMRGGGGRDRMNGGFGNDRLFGGPGNDGIHTGNGRDRVNAGSGNDVINAATRGPAAFVDCGPGRKDRVRINRNETRRVRNCEFVDVPRRIRSNNRPQSPR